jgi:hypothetical protein
LSLGARRYQVYTRAARSGGCWKVGKSPQERTASEGRGDEPKEWRKREVRAWRGRVRRRTRRRRRIEPGDFAERAFGDAADFEQKVEGGVRIGANWGHGKPPWRSGGWKLVGMVAGERIALEYFVRKWRGESQGESGRVKPKSGRPRKAALQRQA